MQNFKISKKIVGAAAAALAGIVLFTGGFTYNEAGHQTHIRTVFGQESVVSEVGWAWKGFGRSTQWKQAQTIQFSTSGKESTVDDAIAVDGFRVTFLGNVDGAVEASTRFRIPQGEQFLRIAKEYRTPENFYQTAVIPAVKETLQTTASMMTADDYFAGARSEFSTTFEDQLVNGQYHVRRTETQSVAVRTQNDDETAVSGRKDGEVRRSQFEVHKLKGQDGNYLRKGQNFRGFGVEVVEARITNILPNEKFQKRMDAVQQSQAELAIARQNRFKEDENKQLVIARGEREVEEKRQATLKDQVERTTQAETSKQLALIEAEKLKEQALIEKQTAATQLETARLEAQRTKTLADAEAHAKKVVIEANGALEQKLSAIVQMNKDMADAIAQAPVPTTVIGGSGDGSRVDDVGNLMKMLTVNQAKALSLDMTVKK